MTPPALAMTPLALGITTPVSGGFRVIRAIAVRQATA